MLAENDVVFPLDCPYVSPPLAITKIASSNELSFYLSILYQSAECRQLDTAKRSETSLTVVTSPLHSKSPVKIAQRGEQRAQACD